MRACARGLPQKVGRPLSRLHRPESFRQWFWGWCCAGTARPPKNASDQSSAQTLESPLFSATYALPVNTNKSRAISPFFSGQTTFSKPITRRPSGLARPAPWGFGFPVPWAVANPAERPQAAHFRKRNGLGKKPATSRRSGFAPHAAVNGTDVPTNRRR